MTAAAPRAAALPAYTIVAMRDDVWIKRGGSEDLSSWDSTGSRWSVDDDVIDRLLEAGATVLRHGEG